MCLPSIIICIVSYPFLRFIIIIISLYNYKFFSPILLYQTYYNTHAAARINTYLFFFFWIFFTRCSSHANANPRSRPRVINIIISAHSTRTTHVIFQFVFTLIRNSKRIPENYRRKKKRASGGERGVETNDDRGIMFI